MVITSFEELEQFERMGGKVISINRSDEPIKDNKDGTFEISYKIRTITPKNVRAILKFPEG